MNEIENKAIEEMARDLQKFIEYDECAARDFGETYVDYPNCGAKMKGD